MITMLARPEIIANQITLQHNAQDYGTDLYNKLKSTTNLIESIKLTRAASKEYYKSVQDHMLVGLREVGLTAARFYNETYELGLSEQEISNIVAQQVRNQSIEHYYGLTLEQRLAAAHRALHLRINRSSSVGKELVTRQLNLSRVFAEVYPFGAQVNLDKRLLLSQATKLEHDIAKVFAGRAGAVLIKWTMSEHHEEQDICDVYANSVDRAVEEYLVAHKFNIETKGVYFITNVPLSPHPNCQCELRPVFRGVIKENKVSRTVEAIRNILLRLKRRKK